MGLLGRAKSMMQGWSAPTPGPQSYNVACAEGHRLRGERTESYQALRCPTCGEGIFVLPRSPLPEPAVPASASRSRVAAAVEAFPEDEPLVLTDPLPSMASLDTSEEPEAEIDWVDEVPAEPRSKPAKAQPSPQPELAAAPKSNRPPTPPTPKREPIRQAPARPAIVVEPRPTLAEWGWKHRNVLLFVGLLILIAGTVAIRRHRQRLDELPKIAELGLTEGMEKLDAGEFATAKKILAEAADAVDGLGGRVDGSETIRQGALEAAIFADLASEGLDEIVEQADGGDKEWPSRFAAKYKGQSIILDPPVSEVPDPARPNSGYKVSQPIYFGRGPKPKGKGRVDLAGFRLFELSKPQIGDQKPFGARLASVELDTASNEWVVTFEPNSGVYITRWKALQAIDWPEPEAPAEPGP